ncbi:MAG: hypothetical protein IT347_01480 [Candidatus Eisenbacteria bacterium]|nr:hypothetical protein [Candidatus Eisenbacteria bacterium]
MKLRPLDERGLTLTEVTIVAAIGVLVLLGLGGFYLNSQSTWLDASSQSITQREGTLITQAIADSVRESGGASAPAVPDAEHAQVHLFRFNQASGTLETTAFWCFWWDPADSLVHQGPDPATDDRGPLSTSRVERFRVVADNSLVQVALRLRSATGEPVEVSTSAMMRNR